MTRGQFVRVYGGLLAVLPPEFRARYASEMSADFDEGLESLEHRGRAATIRYVAATGVDLVRTAGQEWRQQLRPAILVLAMVMTAVTLSIPMPEPPAQAPRPTTPLSADLTPMALPLALLGAATVLAAAARRLRHRWRPALAAGLFGVGVVMFLTATLLGQQKPDFSGDWTLNRAASSLAPEVAAVRAGSVRIDHREPSFHFERTFTIDGIPPQRTEYTISTDGTTQAATGQRGMTTMSTLRWEGAALLLEMSMRGPAFSGTNVVRYELLENGRRLRATEQLRSAQTNHDNIWIFDRTTPLSSPIPNP